MVRHITLVQTQTFPKHHEVSDEKRITLKSRISSRFSVQSRSTPKVKEKFVLLSSWCQDPSSGQVPSGSICPWPHRTELGTAQEKQRWASFLEMWKSTEALDPHHSHPFSAWPPARYQLVPPESMKTWRNVSNTQHQWWSGFGLAKTNTRTSRLNFLSVCEFVAGKYEMTGGLHPPCWLHATTVMFPCPRSHNGCVSNAN